jgi:hypothetical protein
MLMSALSTPSIEFILRSLLRRAPYPPPSDPASQHRAAIVSSSLDQGSPAERISSSLALCQHFGFGFGPVIQALSSDGAFFSFAWLRCEPTLCTRCNLGDGREPHCALCIGSAVMLRHHRLTVCRCSKCMADMLTNGLLTKRSKSILSLSLVTPLRILLPRTRV